MIKTILVVLSTLFISVAYAEDISFRAEWEGPTTRIDGTSGTATDFVLYVCDEPISSVTESPRGSCEGNMQSFVVQGQSYNGTYVTEGQNVTLYARVSAREHISVDGQMMIMESDLSEQQMKTFMNYIPLSPPGHFVFTGTGPAIFIVR